MTNVSSLALPTVVNENFHEARLTKNRVIQTSIYVKPLGRIDNHDMVSSRDYSSAARDSVQLQVDLKGKTDRNDVDADLYSHETSARG